MKFVSPLQSGTLIQRYKRFLADIRLDNGDVITATCPNTGSMIGLKEPDMRVWVSTSDSATRKYKHTWEMVEHDLGGGPTLVGINTSHPNRIVEEGISGGRIKALQGYSELKREQKYGKNSRIDILLSDAGKGVCYVEVKNVHMSRKAGLAEFPDSVTERGAKHLGELADMVRNGHRAVMVFLIQRGDVSKFQLARDVDRAYGAAYDAALAGGVEMLAVRCKMGQSGIEVDKAIPIAETVRR